MPIEVIYKCNLCREEVTPNGLGKKFGRRLKWILMDDIELVHLTDREASEVVICGQCLIALKGQLLKTTTESLLGE